MNANTRSRKTGVFLASLAAMMLVAPASILAHGQDRHDRRRHGHDFVSHDAYRPWYGNSMRSRLARAGRVHGNYRYYCKPCRHGFHSAHSLRWHVHRQHQVPLWRVPFVIAHGVLHGAFAWIFYG